MYKKSNTIIEPDYYKYKGYSTSKINAYTKGWEYVDWRKTIKTVMKAFVKTGEVSTDILKVKPWLIHNPHNSYKFIAGMIN